MQKVTVNTPMSLGEMRRLSDEELNAMYKEAQGHTHSPEFQEMFNADFSYTSLTNEMKNRGIELRFKRCRAPKSTKSVPDAVRKTEISMSKEGMTVKRRFITVDSDIYDQWLRFIEKFPYPSVVTTAAFKQFMDDYDKGEIVIKMSW